MGAGAGRPEPQQLSCHSRAASAAPQAAAVSQRPSADREIASSTGTMASVLQHNSTNHTVPAPETIAAVLSAASTPL